MSKKAVYSMVLFVVLIGALSVVFNVQKVEAQYQIIYIKADGSIDPATANITSPDNATYIFTADINARIVVEKDNIVVDGAGYTVQGPGSSWIGISLGGRNNVTIKNVEVTNFAGGIYLSSSSNNTITGNTVSSNNEDGIVLSYSSNNTVSGNTVSNDYEGIYLGYSSNNTITGNNVSNHDYGISLWHSNHNTITGNTVSDNIDGISLASSSNNTISGNDVSNNDEGGIILSASSDNALSGNHVEGNIAGIRAGSALVNSVLIQSTNNTILENNIVTNTNGVDIVGVLFTTVSRNYIAENSQYGISLDAANNNTISANIIVNNNWGIFYDGLCDDNIAFHNTFIGNVKHVEVSPGEVNVWDDGLEGNYWSNYTGIDLNRDGLGESEHEIYQNNIDHHPLMGPFHSFNTSLGISVNVISNSTVDGFTYESPGLVRFTVFNATQNQMSGFCRVTVPYDVLSPPFNVTIDGATPTFWNYTLYDNGTHRWIYFEYTHSTREIVIIPEFPALMLLPLFMIISLLAALVCRRRRA